MVIIYSAVFHSGIRTAGVSFSSAKLVAIPMISMAAEVAFMKLASYSYLLLLSVSLNPLPKEPLFAFT